MYETGTRSAFIYLSNAKKVVEIARSEKKRLAGRA